MMAPHVPNDPQLYYQSELDEQKKILKNLTGRWRRYAFIRGGLFLASLFPLLLAARTVAGVNVPWLVLSATVFLGFLVFAFFHERMTRQIRISRLLYEMHLESLQRIDRKLEEVFAPPCIVPDSFAPTAQDLDLSGQQSLYTLLATPRTPFGVDTLRDWIVGGCSAEEVYARQIAVAELKDQQQWRQSFRLRCEQLAASQAGPSRFVEWAESENWVDQRQWLLWVCRSTTILSLLSIVLPIFGLVPLVVAGPTLLIAITLNFMISVFFAGSIHDIFNQISSHQDEMRHYLSLFREVTAFNSESLFLQEIQDDLTGEFDVRQKIEQIGKWNWLANIRRNGVFFILYLVFEFMFMWDIHILERLERWKNANGPKVRIWFQALGRWEAILALSKLAHDNPDWTFPNFVTKSGNATISGVQLGHPLLPESRVCNDVVVGPRGTVLLVSGSNMSGKSTLLRCLGVNIVLAQMGSVVCAQQLTLPPVHIESSMRIVDSLASGTSFFMAELKRLKQIVDAATRFKDQQDRTLLFLLDEILQGTNSRERQIAVSRVVDQLISHGAIGAISTHDLELASTRELKDRCIPVYFSEQFINDNGNKKMVFDYRMREGISDTTNALKLLELVGLSASPRNSRT